MTEYKRSMDENVKMYRRKPTIACGVLPSGALVIGAAGIETHMIEYHEGKWYVTRLVLEPLGPTDDTSEFGGWCSE